MKLLILNASPKREASLLNFLRYPPAVSSALSKKRFLCGAGKTLTMRFQLGSADAVCISFPLYVDGLPSHLVEFLSLAEEYCKARSLRFRLYAIATTAL